MIRRSLLLTALCVACVLVLSSPVLAQEVNCDDFPNQAAAQQALKDDSSDPKGLDAPPALPSPESGEWLAKIFLPRQTTIP
jgi:hypothetical protein